MADFLEKLLSGRYPQVEKVWRARFNKILDQAFENLDFNDELVDPVDVKADVVRLEAVLDEERSRHAAVRRELEIVKVERDELLYRLESAKRELLT